MNLGMLIKALSPICESPGTGSITQLEKMLLRDLLSKLEWADRDTSAYNDSRRNAFWKSSFDCKAWSK